MLRRALVLGGIVWTMAGPSAAAQIVINPGLFPTDTPLNANRTASDTLVGLAPHEGVTIDATYGLTGTSRWNGGVQFTSSLGVEQLRTQNRNSGFEPNTATMVMAFSSPVRELTIAQGGMDFQDTVRIEAFLRGTPIDLAASFVTDLTCGVVIDSAADGTLQLRGPGGKEDDFRDTQYRLVFPADETVDELRFAMAKQTQSSSNVTLAFFEFDREADPIPADDGGTAVPGDEAIVDVRTNDLVSGAPATRSNSILSVAPSSTVPPTLSFDPSTGAVRAVPGAVAGTYSFDYRLCEAANPSRCAEAAATVTVQAKVRLRAEKTVSTAVPDTFCLSGEDVIYALSVRNEGNAPVDADSLYLIDTLPRGVTFRNLPINGIGSVVGFEGAGSGVTFDEAADLAFSDRSVRPGAFADRRYTPSHGYDPSVRHVCVAPKGALAPAGGTRPSTFTLRFRTRIK